jgi:hypothetical protein
VTIWPRKRLRSASSSARLTALDSSRASSSRLERLHRHCHLSFDVAGRAATQPAQELERHEDAKGERDGEAYRD